MAPPRQVDRDIVVAMLREGKSQHAVAKALGCGTATVNRIAQEYGIDAEQSATQKAVAARRDYALAERLEFLNEIFDKARSMLKVAATPHEIQQLAVTAGILIDKRRLEDGEATSRAEVTGNDARDRIARRVDELASRRGAARVA